MLFGNVLPELPESLWFWDALEISNGAGLWSGCFTAAFSWKQVHWIKGFGAGYLSVGAAVGAYLVTALLIDRSANPHLMEWARPLSFAAAVGASLAVGALFCAPLDVVLLANVVGAFCYHFFAKESLA